MRSLMVLQVSKSDHTSGYCEDAWSLRGSDGLAASSLEPKTPAWDRMPGCLSAALSDGASTSSGAALWASLLCQDAATFEGLWDLHTEEAPWLEGCRSEWKSRTEEELGEDAPWYAMAAMAMGAHATLLALRIEESGWKALAVGDSNLFLVREGRLCRAFPIEQAEMFEQAPSLIASLSGGRCPVHRTEGISAPGDVFILATDAMARFLMEQEIWNWAVSLLDDPSPESRFFDAVQKGREARQLKDDDTTLMLLRPASRAMDASIQDCLAMTPADCGPILEPRTKETQP